MGSYKLYVPNEKEWSAACAENRYNSTVPGVRVYENVLVEPLKRINTQAAELKYIGGVCREDGTFIAGLRRSDKNPKMTMSLYESYRPGANDVIEYLPGEYVFGGEVVHMFGHIITDSLTRAWFLVKHLTEKQKIIFVSTTKEISPAFFSIMDMLGISRDRIIIADRIYKCEKLTVPDQSFLLYGYYTDEFLTAYRAIGKKALASVDEGKKYSKKIYLTRTRLSKKDCFGEEYFEEFYKKHGYEIIAPEQYPFDEQIRILAGAEEVVSTLGTLTHLILFIPNKVKLTVLLRTNEVGAARQQTMMNAAMDIDYELIDVSMGIMPTSHAGGVFLMGPTPHWKRYLDENGITYTEDELKMDWSYLHPYLVEYTNIYTKLAYPYKRIKGSDIFDVINGMSKVFLGKELSRDAMQTKSKAQYENDIKKLSAPSKKLLLYPDLLRAVEPKKKASFAAVCFAELTEAASDTAKYKALFKKIKGKDIVRLTEGAAQAEPCDADIRRLAASAVDAVINEPMHFASSVEAQYEKSHGKESLAVAISILNKLYPEYASEAKITLSGKELYPKLDMLMKGKAFADFAKWLIPILGKLTEDGGSVSGALLPKLSERLKTLYFKHNGQLTLAFFG